MDPKTVRAIGATMLAMMTGVMAQWLIIQAALRPPRSPRRDGGDGGLFQRSGAAWIRRDRRRVNTSKKCPWDHERTPAPGPNWMVASRPL